jgi:hypothetical protein
LKRNRGKILPIGVELEHANVLGGNVSTSISGGIFVLVLLVVALGILLYVLLAPLRAQKRELRELLLNGKAAIGTVVAIDQSPRDPMGRSGPRYDVTVEFTPTDYAQAVRFRINASEHEVSRLGVYQQVAIHYRDQIPVVGIIDELVK